MTIRSKVQDYKQVSMTIRSKVLARTNSRFDKMLFWGILVAFSQLPVANRAETGTTTRQDL